jgi:alkylhydroperoxidase family enzyme
MNEPRILPLPPDELGEDAMELARRQRGTHGLETVEVPETIATLMRHPQLYKAFIDFVGRRAHATVLGPRDVELVVLRAAWLCRSGYVWGEHVNFGKKAGITDDEIERLIEGSSAPGWNTRDRALLALVEELHETADVSDGTWAALAADFDAQQLIELLFVVGSYHQVAFLYNAMRVRLIPGNPGLTAR